MTRFGRRTIIAGLAIVIAGAVLVSRLRSRSDAVLVTTARIERIASLSSVVTASGEIVASRYANIGSTMMGRLVALTVKEGDRVTAGQVLARIDPVQAASGADAAAAALGALDADARAAAAQQRTAQATLAETQSRADETASALERAKQLRDAGLLPAAEFDKAEAAAASSRAQVASAAAAVDRARQAVSAASQRVAQGAAERTRARDQLQKTAITSPIDGVVSRLDVKEGEMVVIGVQNQPGTTLMTISDLSAINAEVKVAEADVMRLVIGQPASVTVEALPERRFTGRVIAIGASALPQVGTQVAAREFRVTVQIDKADATLPPGLTCDAEIVAAERRNVLVAPLQAVVERNGRRGVFAKSGDRATFTPVTTGIIGGLSMEVEGAAEGTEIVSGPIQALRDLQDGAAVRQIRQ